MIDIVLSSSSTLIESSIENILAQAKEAIDEEEENTNKISDAVSKAFAVDEVIDDEEDDEVDEVEEEETDRGLKYYFGQLEDLLVVKVIGNEDDESNRDLSFDWKLQEVSGSQIILKLTFTDPINVTPQDVL